MGVAGSKKDYAKLSPAWGMKTSTGQPSKCHSAQNQHVITFGYANARAPKVRSRANVEPPKMVVPECHGRLRRARSGGSRCGRSGG